MAGPVMTAIWNEDELTAMARGSCVAETSSGTKERDAGAMKARAQPNSASAA